MSQTPDNSSAATLRVASLSTARPTRFALRPEAAHMQAMAEELGLLGLRKLSFTGELSPMGKRDWQLKARLGATVVQPCVTTLEPVTTRIDEDVSRVFLANYDKLQPEGEEAEMPDLDEADPLGEEIALDRVMIEALSLALPLYPRAEGAEKVDLSVTEPGKAPLSDEDVKPFAGLAALRDKLSGDAPDGGPDGENDDNNGNGGGH